MQLFKYVIRNLNRHRLLSSLIAISLAAGLISSFYVLSYVKFEKSYDTHLSQRVFRINQETQKEGQDISRTARTSPAVGPFIQEHLPEVKDFSRMVLMGGVILKTEVDAIREKEVLLADEAHFTQYSYDWLHGSASNMKEPRYVVLDASLSEKLFGTEDPTGKTVEINSTNFEGTYPFTVAGVIQDVGQNTHMRPGLLISYATLYGFVGNEIDQSWNWNNLFTYVTIEGDRKVDELETIANNALMDLQGDQFRQEGIEKRLIFQPVEDIHTNPGYVGEFTPGIDADLLLYLALLAACILVMTYLNFVNLFVVRTLSSAKQMGIRSILGSSNAQLLAMTIADIALLNFISFAVAVTAIQVLNPYVVDYFDLPEASVYWVKESPLLLLVLLLVSIGISSIIPATRFLNLNWTRSVTTRRHTSSPSDVRLYGGLLGVQFLIALFFLSGLVVVYNQVKVINQFDPGLDVEGKYVVQAPFLGMELEVENQDKLFWSEAQRVAGVTKLVAMNEIPGSEIYWRNDGVGRQPGVPVPATFSWLGIGDGYMSLLEIEVIAGRDFDPTKDNFNSSVILNERGIEMLEFSSPAEAVGQKIYLGEHPVEVVGVIKDFYQENVKKLIEPHFFRYAPNDLNYFVLDIDGELNQDKLKEAYQTVFPGAPYDIFSLEEHYNKQYASEKLLSRLILFLSIMAMIISIVGIVGMSIQILQRRAKELIIRKIHGASELQLWNRVAAVFYRIALAAYVISVPLAYVVFKNWTDRFTIGEFPFVEFLIVPGVVLALLVVVSISVQTIKLTRQNPKQILITE